MKNISVKDLIEKLKQYPKGTQIFIDSNLSGELREIWGIKEFYTEDNKDKEYNCQNYFEKRKNKKQVKVIVLCGSY